MMRNQRGQVTAELAVLFTFVIAGFIFMGFYLQRAAQGSTKANTDSIGTQFTVDSPWVSQVTSRSTERIVDVGGEKQAETVSLSCSKGEVSVGGELSGDVDISTACDPEGWSGDSDSILTAPSSS